MKKEHIHLAFTSETKTPLASCRVRVNADYPGFYMNATDAAFVLPRLSSLLLMTMDSASAEEKDGWVALHELSSLLIHNDRTGLLQSAVNETQIQAEMFLEDALGAAPVFSSASKPTNVENKPKPHSSFSEPEKTTAPSVSSWSDA